MVDWSGGNSRSANKPNCIWIAHGSADALEPNTESPGSRTEAIDRIIKLSCQHFEQNNQHRILSCFDFGFAFSRGFATHMPVLELNDQPWLRVWNYLDANIEDDVGTLPGRSPTNKSNRFDVANNLNHLFHQQGIGPFWSVDPNWRNARDAAGVQVFIPQNKPVDFVSNAGVQIPQLRIVDQIIDSDFPFRLFGNGSVGSQMLTGIPKLQQLRQSQELSRFGQCKVWPFETGWSLPNDNEWLTPEARLVLAEVYPSIMPALADQVVDRGQVRAMWHWARDQDHEDALQTRFERPEALTDEQDVIVRCEEGWILH